ncbi:Crp/Fnr family transcriptional regulator [Micromonospora sp. NPDC051196]|uniref:Crp/Fnr family transcriptional regulator n=1 Tax=Micromonospora sp. NPDC051196 TaxID=3155281 RepID=UPI003448FF99
MTPGHPREPFWTALRDDQRAALMRMGMRRRYTPDEVLVRENDTSDCAFVLLDGCVKVSAIAHHGYQAILGLRDAGELIGELAGSDGGLRSATVIALTDVDALRLPTASFGPFVRADPEVAAILRRTLSARLREADRSRAAAGAESAQQRLAALLLHLGQRYGNPQPQGEIVINLALSQHDLAGLALTSHRSLGRILTGWRRDNVVLTGRRRVVLVRPAELARLANGA